MDQQTAPARFVPDPERVRFYEEDARRYAASLRAEDYMEATPQATQRKITLESFDLVSDAWPEVQCFNELLVQYPIAGQRQPGRVVPDNFVVVHPEPLRTLTSFPLDTLTARPFFVLEYVSKHTPRKDYEDNLVRYEQVLRVPYYLIFYPDNEEVTLFRLAGGKYTSVHANDAGRFAVPELELEAALLDGWVRFWFRGALLPLPAELNAELRAERAARLAAERERDAERVARLVAEQRAAELEAELARLRAQPRG